MVDCGTGNRTHDFPVSCPTLSTELPLLYYINETEGLGEKIIRLGSVKWKWVLVYYVQHFSGMVNVKETLKVLTQKRTYDSESTPFILHRFNFFLPFENGLKVTVREKQFFFNHFS